MFSTLEYTEIEALLSEQLIGRIGCHANDITYVVPISYVYDGHYVYGHTREGMKVNMMRQNPEVCFQVDDTRNLDNWKSVVSWGRFEEITDEEERNVAVKKLMGRVLPVVSSETMRLTAQWPFSDAGSRVDGIVFRIRLTRKSGRFEQSSDKAYFAT